MEFRLVYQGPIRTNSNVKERQEIRRQLRGQIAELWMQLPLRESKEVQDAKGKFCKKVGAFTFRPLINQYLCLVCSLHILFLRREEPGSLVGHGGDLDNRLKTLFDSLRMPDKASEIPEGDGPRDDESPFDCLLENDQLITEVGVTTDRLLRPTAEPADSPASRAPTRKSDDVLLVMHVRAHPTKITGENLLLLS